ncbi:Putative Zn-dependent protease, contains TPR repeats [Modicisalibacter ilicicola DSM 19980]|uniref:Putative beta-barrel assembly-enhancing protease n=1 Tax=Modicisalibacter ilicicola DSM 19980 TaxID=1121942 RepID=A0A1M4UPP6_9GAMM|nr:M48 family metalloprotease [Halomonas ilicicola]SHE58563.1 Putative Zn-dependent protease, contains TPR repeats [Halomonas ilicicola DSM 19980]
MLRSVTISVLVGALTFAAPSAPLLADDYGLPSLGSGGSSVSTDQEHRLGRAWLRQFRAQTAAWQDPIAQRYVESVLARLLPYSDLGDTHVIVTLVDSRLLNAFAVPGGIVGVNSGLFSFAASEDAFASVLAHELGHLSQRHFARRMERVEETQLPTMAAMLAGMVIAAGGGGNAGLAAMAGSQAAFIQDQLAYSRRFEQEADRVGLDAMADAGFDPQAMPAMFRAMQRLTSLQGGNPPEFLLTHPVTQSRISDTQGRADQLTPRDTHRDDPTYAMIRARALLELNRSHPAQAMTQLRQDDPPAAALRYLEALIAAEQNRTDAALDSLDSLARELPDLSLIPASAADIALDAGRRDAALARVQRILRLAPDYFPARLLQAEILLQNDPNQAFDVLRELSQQAPEDPQVFTLLAESAGRSGHEVWGHLARAEQLQLTGRIDRAIRQLEVAEDVARRDDDFGMISRIEQRREEYLEYRDALQQL